MKNRFSESFEEDSWTIGRLHHFRESKLSLTTPRGAEIGLQLETETSNSR